MRFEEIDRMTVQQIFHCDKPKPSKLDITKDINAEEALLEHLFLALDWIHNGRPKNDRLS
jgi:hypothetical protein